MDKNNSIFKTLFGAEPTFLKKTCVLTPFISKEILNELQIKEIHKGILYSTGNNDSFSLIVTRMGASFTGDAVLYLQNTNCHNLVFLGSCGAVKTASKPGDLFLAEKALSQDSFVNMLRKKELKDEFYPDKDLLDKFSKFNLNKGVCLTVGSLKLEEEYLETLKGENIDIVDMETSAFFAASSSIGKKAIAILFVTDVLKTYPYHIAFRDIKKITLNSLRDIIQILNNTPH